MGLSQQAISYELIILTSSNETERKKKEISIGGEKYSKEKNMENAGTKEKCYWNRSIGAGRKDMFKKQAEFHNIPLQKLLAEKNNTFSNRQFWSVA